MSEQLKKIPCGIGLLAHVGASRREPHFHSYIPGPKTGDFFMPCGSKAISRLENTTICCGFVKTETAAYGG